MENLLYTEERVTLQLLFNTFLDKEYLPKCPPPVQSAYVIYRNSLTETTLSHFYETSPEHLKTTSHSDTLYSLICKKIEQTREFARILYHVSMSFMQEPSVPSQGGVCGVLFPDGQFKSCGAGRHDTLIENCSWRDQHNSIYLMVLSGGRFHITYSPLEEGRLLTQAQQSWLKEHIGHMSPLQQQEALQLIQSSTAVSRALEL